MMTCYQQPFQAMGTACDIQLFAASRQQAERIAQMVISDVRRLEARYSRYRPDSVLSQINQLAQQGGSVQVDTETASLLDYAATCYAQSDGLFDITSGILRQAWRFNSSTLPSTEQLASLLTRVGWHHLHWQAPTLTFLQPGLEIDFGGIVKEYAVDRAAALCAMQGVQHGLINLGGDIKVIGPRADGSPWRVGIRHPRQAHSVLTTVNLYHGALASSGDYARAITLDGVHYSHVLNPHTGWPVRHLATVSVLADYCVVAGSASTIAMLKEQAGISWLQTLGLQHVWMDIHGVAGGTILPAS